jgi:hypothetical protein
VLALLMVPLCAGLASGWAAYGAKPLAPRPGESIEPTLHPVIPQWWPDLPWESASTHPIHSTRDGNPAERVILDPCSQH